MQQGHARMKSVVGEERSQSCGRMTGIIVTELCHGEESGPISLLEVTVDLERLNLDSPFVHLSGDGRQTNG